MVLVASAAVMDDGDHLVRSVRGLLEARGPSLSEDIERHLRGAGLMDEYEAIDDWDLGDDFWTRGDGRWVLTDPLLDGLVLTHRLTAEELAAGEIVHQPDLTIVDFGTFGPLPLADGGSLATELRGIGEPMALVGPDGWLDGFEAGQLVALRRSGQEVAVSVVDDITDGAPEIEALAATAGRWIREGSGEEETPLVMDALAADPTLFRKPVPPLSELLAAAGFERRGWQWGHAGQRWDPPSKRRVSGCCVDALEAVWAAFEVFDPASALVGAGDIVSALAHGDTARRFVGDASTIVGATEARAFLDQLAGAVRGRDVAAPLFGRALVALDEGDALAAEALSGRAARADADYGPALELAAVLALDRGDIDRAITLGSQVADGVVDLPWLREEQARSRRMTASVGRNERCPCGSGRKFKQCCMGGSSAPLTERTRLLMHRLALFVMSEPRRAAEVISIAHTMLELAGGDEDDDSELRRWVDDPLGLDLANFEGGLVAQYLAERGPLLADDERDFLVLALDEPRRVWEVVDVDEGTGMTVRDTATGETVWLDERSGSEGIEPGELLLARALPCERDHVVIGALLRLPLRARDSALAVLDSAPSAHDLAAWYGHLHAMPGLANREGEPLVLCRAVLAPGDGVDAVAILDDVLDAGDHGVWHEHVEFDGGEMVIRGTVALDGGQVVVEANSEIRHERLVDLLVDRLDAAVVDDQRQTAVEAVRDRRAGVSSWDEAGGDDGGWSFGDPDMPPEMAEALEEYMAGYERRWIDSELPALGGLTPRQAHDDPTRREDLAALLREIRQSPGPMSAERIEAMLTE